MTAAENKARLTKLRMGEIPHGQGKFLPPMPVDADTIRYVMAMEKRDGRASA